jgi:hypothetical protein
MDLEIGTQKLPLYPWLAKFVGKNRKMRFFSIISKFYFMNPFWRIFTIFSACFIYGFYSLHSTMFHRPLTNSSSLKIAAAYSPYISGGFVRSAASHVVYIQYLIWKTFNSWILDCQLPASFCFHHIFLRPLACCSFLQVLSVCFFFTCLACKDEGFSFVYATSKFIRILFLFVFWAGVSKDEI